MGRVRRNRKSKKNPKRKSFLVFFGLIFIVFFLAVCTVQQVKETDFPEMTTIPNDDSLSKKELPLPPVETQNDEDIVDRPTEFYNYISTITADPEFKSVNFTTGQEGELISHSAIVLSYNEEHEQAHWVSYKLTSAMLGGKEKRTDKFKEDPKVTTKSASPLDYRLSGYDRGHLAPAGDFTYDATAMAESFYMSNMSPQTPSFNRGIWKKLEDQVRYWAKENEEIYIITGPVIQKKEITLGLNRVTVPDYFYKVILDIHPPEYKAIAFLMKNEKSSRPLLDFAITVDSLERFTGLDFFPMLPDTLEVRLQNMKNHEIWFE
ncbi:MAG TPA: DNA/RNA non-specific endonuclease [Anditalea sp.]|nr:DNA/RNA non-specific endonuclease [Anditalea sp.]